MLHSLVTACYSCGAQITFGVEAEIALCPFCGKYNDRPRVRGGIDRAGDEARQRAVRQGRIYAG